MAFKRLKHKQIEDYAVADIVGLQADLDAKAAAITAEEGARQAGDTTLQTAIDAEKARIDAILAGAGADKDTFAEVVSFINSVDLENDNALAAQVVALQTADTTLQSNIDAEAVARAAADVTLQSNIDAEETARIAGDAALQTAINDEAALRVAGDATLQGNITAEETARIAADGVLQGNIDAEVTARTNADTALQNSLNTLEGEVAKTGDDESISGNWDFGGTLGFGGVTFTGTSTDLSVSAGATELVTAEAAKSYADSLIAADKLYMSRTDSAGDDSATSFSYSVAGQIDQMVIATLNGQVLIPGHGYTDSGTAVVFDVAPEATDIVTILKWYKSPN